MTNLPTISYNSPIEDVQRVLDAGGVIWVVKTSARRVETLQCVDADSYRHEVTDNAGSLHSYSDLGYQWEALRFLNSSSDVYWSVEYPTNA